MGLLAGTRRALSTPMTKRLERSGEAFDQALGRIFSKYRDTYRRWVMDSHRFMDVKGLATAGDHTPRIDDVYVDVALISISPHLISQNLLGSIVGETGSRHSIHEFIDSPKSRVLAVVGPPGCGKTTLLARVARDTAASTGQRRLTPVFFALRDHVSRITQDRSIDLVDIIRDATRSCPAEEPQGWWERELERGRCLILLDGFDEIGREHDRQELALWLEQQIDRYPRNRFILTSRPHGYRTAVIRQASVLTILPFTPAQVRTFIHQWYVTAETQATNAQSEDLPAVRMRAREGAQDLLDRLQNAPKLGVLTSNPLLLTMIANVHRFRGALPGSRVDLYAEICQVMLSRRIQAKRLPEPLPWPTTERIISRLAFEMMTIRTRDMATSQILEVVSPLLRRSAGKLSPAEFVTGATTNGLLVERDRDVYAFAHLTFQEYLAAVYIRENGLVSALTSNVTDDWWRETTLLYSCIADADAVVQSCLNHGTTAALLLAFDCADESHELAPELRAELDLTLDGVFREDAERSQQRSAAAILASRLARRAVTTPSGTKVSKDLVDVRLYWLFVQDTATPSPDQPCSPDGDLDAPATGMWADDAVAFADWLNKITGGYVQGRFRLPTVSELNDPTFRAATMLKNGTHGPDFCIWARTDPTTKELTTWPVKDSQSAYHVHRGDMASVFKTDVVEMSLASRISYASAVIVLHLARELSKVSSGAGPNVFVEPLSPSITKSLAELQTALHSGDIPTDLIDVLAPSEADSPRISTMRVLDTVRKPRHFEKRYHQLAHEVDRLSGEFLLVTPIDYLNRTELMGESHKEFIGTVQRARALCNQINRLLAENADLNLEEAGRLGRTLVTSLTKASNDRKAAKNWRIGELSLDRDLPDKTFYDCRSKSEDFAKRLNAVIEDRRAYYDFIQASLMQGLGNTLGLAAFNLLWNGTPTNRTQAEIMLAEELTRFSFINDLHVQRVSLSAAIADELEKHVSVELQPRSDGWHSNEAASRLRSLVSSAFRQRDAISAAEAAEIRLLAVALAGNSGISRELACSLIGATIILQKRTSGQLPANEAILPVLE